MSNPIIMHVNYAEQGQTILEMCQLAAKLGYAGIEFRRKRGGVEETATEYLDAIESAVEKTGLADVLFGGPGPDLMNPDADYRKKEVEECVSFFREASRRFKLSICNTMAGSMIDDSSSYFMFEKQGSAIATDDHFQWAAEGFQVLGDVATELGFKFAFELHNCYIHDLPEPSRKLVDMIDRESVGLNLDLGNVLLSKSNTMSITDCVKKCGDRLYELHLKNLYLVGGVEYQNYISCPLADGMINNREFLRAAFNLGFDGPLCIEAPRAGDREWFAREDMEYLRFLLDELGR